MLLIFVLFTCFSTYTPAKPTTNIIPENHSLQLYLTDIPEKGLAQVPSSFPQHSFFSPQQNIQGVCGAVAPLTIVVIGSSTAEGHGVSKAESWVGRYTAYLKNIDSDHEVINLAKGGYTTYDLMPSDFTPPSGRPTPKTDRNITKAIALNPDGIIINLPSNDAAKNYSAADQMQNFAVMYQKAQEKGIPVWITTTQPRDALNTAQNEIQTAVRDAILNTYGVYALDFWTDIVRYDENQQPKIKTALALGDGVHLNAEGHRVLFEEVKQSLVYERIAGLYTSVKSGSYTDKAVWNLNTVPGSEAMVTIQSGHTVTLSRDEEIRVLTVKQQATLHLAQEQLRISCSWHIQGTLSASQGSLELTGPEDMLLQGFDAVKTLKMNKTAGVTRLDKDLTVTGTLALTAGVIRLEGYDLTLEKPLSLTGGSASSYVQTTAQGDLVYRIDESMRNEALVFPVGDNQHYTPFTFVLKAGTIADGKLKMTVADTHPPEAGAASPLLSRYWNLRQEGLSDYQYYVKYQYLQEDVELAAGDKESDLRIIKYSDEDGWLIGGQVDTQTNTLWADGISSFSIFSGGNHIEGATPLPIVLADFHVTATPEGYAALYWETASEQNNDYFVVERSADAEHWTPLTRIKGAGTSYEPRHYHYTDLAPFYGNNFYRLKQVDFDERSDYSPVVSFYSEQPLLFHMTLLSNPLPIRESMAIRIITPEPASKATLAVYDVTGRMYLSREITLKDTQTFLTLPDRLPTGLYLVTLRQGYQVAQRKLLVE